LAKVVETLRELWEIFHFKHVKTIALPESFLSAR